MDRQQDPPEFILDVFTDPRSLRDVVKAILHTIFFTRFFPSLVPRTRDVLDLTLPYVDDNELETMIDQRASALERQLDAERSSGGGGNPNANANGGGRGQVAIQFFEKRRRKAWLSRGDEEVCWESWTLKVTVAEPRTESERAKVRRAMEQTLLTTAMKIVTFANTHKDHIPPITTQGGNPFPFKISIDQKETGWAARMRIY
ncbi:uncharacterized protein UV8b_03772 [Ustilaginoidea virens]|uniref:Autophagy-related protein 101 n=1 Tax=Ustilaginoidea virens TaxID=1159556 RepID=A0A063C864_USTVR|nr:uncharacterized protein UV8b_03772 [Ustilaginoidea virens]QUC19531.1 hypothetical protein UV8b_03772 [Ustilaginoidea virens]GAO19978.1 hypothetical protein UVI_02063750 [Ustilaginoidea virens]